MKIDPKHIDHNLLVLFLLDEVSSEERKAVEDWINASVNNKDYFSSLEKTWLETGNIEPAPVVVDIDSAWDKMKTLISQEDEIQHVVPQRKLNARTSRRAFMYAAIAAMLILSVASVVFTDWFKRSVEPLPFVFESFAEVLIDTLSDGSSIALNENTKLVFSEPTEDKERKVNLEGEAFFAVAADSSKPFVIEAGIGAIKVLGTKFNVKAYENSDLEVLVESGMVELSVRDSLGNPLETLLLEAGEKGIISHENKHIYKSEDLMPDELFWANRKLIFRETSLQKVLEVLQNYYSFEVEVENDEVMNCLLSASFTNQEIPHIMEVIAASFELSVSQENSTYQFIASQFFGLESVWSQTGVNSLMIASIKTIMSFVLYKTVKWA